ncbi:hypothetical protein GCM10027418_22650 [Mariniluteicoccus endophyticus]
MDIDIFKEILVPVIGGLGIFLLGLEFMDRGIQALSVNKMREWLAKAAGTPIKGVVAGTVITGIIQSSTAMTVMTVGLVNAGVLSLRSAISVIMGANIGTTLGNGLIALPLGPIGLLFGGIFAMVYCFAKPEKVRNIALAAMGFSLVFYGLNLMTGGLKPLKNMPAVMNVLSNLDSSTIIGVISCALIAALITAMIHSSSATIGIVMGMGASGILEWQTAIAFAIGADLGTTITSWIASLNLSKNAKRTAYAHIAFNFIGVCVVLALFFPAIQVLKWVMGFMGGDPGVPVMVDGKETFPLVPLAVGMFSIFFNIFNVLILFPFVGTFERFLSKVGHTDDEDEEDYALPKFLDEKELDNFAVAIPAVQKETHRSLEAGSMFLDIARGKEGAPKDPQEHWEAVDSLSREIRGYSARLFRDGLTRDQMDLVASLIEEADFTAQLNQVLAQVAGRVRLDEFSPAADTFLTEAVDRLDRALETSLDPDRVKGSPTIGSGQGDFEDMRWRIIDSSELPVGEKGAMLAILGSIERAEGLVDRIAEERASVNRAQITEPAAAAEGVTQADA